MTFQIKQNLTDMVVSLLLCVRKVQHEKTLRKPFLESNGGQKAPCPPLFHGKGEKTLRVQWMGTNREHQQTKRVKAPGLT